MKWSKDTEIIWKKHKLAIWFTRFARFYSFFFSFSLWFFFLSLLSLALYFCSFIILFRRAISSLYYNRYKIQQISDFNIFILLSYFFFVVFATKCKYTCMLQCECCYYCNKFNLHSNYYYFLKQYLTFYIIHIVFKYIYIFFFFFFMFFQKNTNILF